MGEKIQTTSLIARVPEQLYWDFTAARGKQKQGSNTALNKAIELYVEYAARQEEESYE